MAENVLGRREEREQRKFTLYRWLCHMSLLKPDWTDGIHTHQVHQEGDAYTQPSHFTPITPSFSQPSPSTTHTHPHTSPITPITPPLSHPSHLFSHTLTHSDDQLRPHTHTHTHRHTHTHLYWLSVWTKLLKVPVSLKLLNEIPAWVHPDSPLTINVFCKGKKRNCQVTIPLHSY